MKNSKPGILAVISLSILLASLGTSIVNIALPTFTTYFSATFQSVQWIVISYLLTITISVTIVGKVADNYGHRRVLLFGVLLFAVSSFSSVFAPSILMLIILRGFQGMGAAALMTISITIVRKNKENIKTGSAMGLIGTMSAIGTAMGPSVGGLIVSAFGWQSIFLLLFFLGIPTFLLGLTFINKDSLTPENNQKVNTFSVLLLVLSIATYALSMTFGKDQLGLHTLVLILIAVLSGWLFFYVQNRSHNPLIDASVFKNKALTSSLFANFVVSTIMMTTLIVGPFFLKLGIGLNETKVGLVMSVGPFISILTGIPSGKAVDKTGAEIIVKIGLLCLFTGILALSVLPAIWGLTGYITGIVLLTPGYQLFQAANNTSVMTNAGQHQEGIISGILNLSRNLGLITGASIMGALFSISVGSSPISMAKPEALFFGLKITFIAAAVLLLLVIVMAFTKNNKNRLN